LTNRRDEESRSKSIEEREVADRREFDIEEKKSVCAKG